MTQSISVKDVLQETRDLLADEGTWTQGAMATNNYGELLYPEHSRATRFCLMGAVARVVFLTGASGTDAHRDALRRIRAELPPEQQGLVKFNDAKGRTKKDVLDILDKAISRGE